MKRERIKRVFTQAAAEDRGLGSHHAKKSHQSKNTLLCSRVYQTLASLSRFWEQVLVKPYMKGHFLLYCGMKGFFDFHCRFSSYTELPKSVPCQYALLYFFAALLLDGRQQKFPHVPFVISLGFWHGWFLLFIFTWLTVLAVWAALVSCGRTGVDRCKCV